MGGDGQALRHSGVTQKRDMPDAVWDRPPGSLHTRIPGLLHFHGHRHAPSSANVILSRSL
jgi:hypothetical protein